MDEPKSKNERYFQSTGKYKSEKDKRDEKYGKEYKPQKLNGSLTGY